MPSGLCSVSNRDFSVFPCHLPVWVVGWASQAHQSAGMANADDINFKQAGMGQVLGCARHRTGPLHQYARSAHYQPPTHRLQITTDAHRSATRIRSESACQKQAPLERRLGRLRQRRGWQRPCPKGSALALHCPACSGNRAVA